MAAPRSNNDDATPGLRREVIAPRRASAEDASFYRTVAVLSVLLAMLAGALDAAFWRAEERRAAARSHALGNTVPADALTQTPRCPTEAERAANRRHVVEFQGEIIQLELIAIEEETP